MVYVQLVRYLDLTADFKSRDHCNFSKNPRYPPLKNEPLVLVLLFLVVFIVTFQLLCVCVLKSICFLSLWGSRGFEVFVLSHSALSCHGGKACNRAADIWNKQQIKTLDLTLGSIPCAPTQQWDLFCVCVCVCLPSWQVSRILVPDDRYVYEKNEEICKNVFQWLLD